MTNRSYYSDFWPNTLDRIAISREHLYTINRPPTLQWFHDNAAAEVEGTPLGQASLVDRIIFDRARTDNGPRRFFVLSLWADSMEFSLIIPVGPRGIDGRCIPLYVPTPKERTDGDATYWEQIFSGVGVRGRKSQLVAVKDSNICCRVVWNEFVVESVESTILRAKRVHIIAKDVVRHLLQTVPLLKDGLFPSQNEAKALETERQAIKRFHMVYRALLRHADWISVLRGATLRNLVSLSSILLDRSRRVTLVTGLPGTGKEAFSKAIHYGDRTWRTDDLLETTGPALANGDIVEKLKAEIQKKGRISTILIDEFNKALVSKPKQLSRLLRIFENSKDILDAKIEFVLAASQHLEELAVNGPQDFWTRISHVLRVVHPLARVDEEEGRDFIKTFFHSQWYKLVSDSKFPTDLRAAWCGWRENDDWQTSPLCQAVHRAVEASLVPLVVRDVLSVRGVRSMIGQVFSRVRWAREVTQFKPDVWASEAERDKELERRVVEAVNAAVQEVLVVLNESRVTPRQA